MRTIGVVTVARSDYGIYQPVLKQLAAERDVRLLLFVGGMHLAPQFGHTVEEIEKDGYEIAARVDMDLTSDTPTGIAKSMGIGVTGFAHAFAETRPDLLVVLGDRFEMTSAALAALPFNIPVAHIHGGEVTRGAIDDSLRHAITKLSHLHFVATEEHARRVAQLGEEPWRITVSGVPALQNIGSIQTMSAQQLEERCGISFRQPPLLITYHSETLAHEGAEKQLAELLAALAKIERPLVFTAPNADTNGRIIAARMQEFVQAREDACFVENLGTAAYFSLMAIAGAMVGNSSSGIIEAASFKLPVVNIGRRQEGRTRAANVIDVAAERGAIKEALRKALSDNFKAKLEALENPYYRPDSAATIVEKLRSVALNDELVAKRFHDLPTRATGAN